MTRLLAPAANAVISLLTEVQHEYISGIERSYTETNTDYLHLERTANQDNTQPQPILFLFESDRMESVFYLSTSPNMLDPIIRRTRDQQVTLDNLLAGTTYYWQVNDSDIRSFQTEFAYPRFLNVGGLSNVRDNGGRISQNGRILKQGLLYRGSEMNLHHIITDEGIRVMRNDLKIRTDLDLRAEGVDYGGPLGNEVDWVVIPIQAYANFVTDYKRECKAIFDLLADEARYPIYYHCWGGADRTGTIAALIAAVLNLSDEDILLDYEITSLSIWGDRSRKSDLWKGLEAQLGLYDGADFSERARSFLRDCDVSDEQMKKICSILLE